MTESLFIAQAPTLRSKAIAVASRWVDADEAEDIAQDALLRLWTLREAVQTPQHAEALVAKMAWQRCADVWRRCRTVPIDSGQAVADDRTAAPDAHLEQADNEEWLHRRLASLPSMQYQVLRLRQVEHICSKLASGRAPATMPSSYSACSSAMRSRTSANGAKPIADASTPPSA